MSWVVTVDSDKCVLEGECVNVCPCEVFEIIDAINEVVNEEDCLGCESCVEVCPHGAITLKYE